MCGGGQNVDARHACPEEHHANGRKSNDVPDVAKAQRAQQAQRSTHRSKKLMQAMPAQKNTRPLAAKEMVSQMLSNAPLSSDRASMPHLEVMLPYSPKMTTAITPEPCRGGQLGLEIDP